MASMLRLRFPNSTKAVKTGEINATKTMSSRTAFERQRGVALITALLVLLLLSVLGAAAIATSILHAKIGIQYNTIANRWYLADAGIEQARENLRQADISGTTTLSQRLATAAGTDDVVSIATNFSELQATDDVPYINNATMSDTAGNPVGQYYVYLRNDAADGRTSTTDSNFTVTLFSIGVIGSNRQSLEATVAKGQFPPLSAALILDGPVGTFNGANSDGFVVDGTDTGASGAPNEHAIGTMSAGDIPTVISGIPKNRLGNYSGVNSSPDVQDISGTTNPSLTTVSGLEELVSRISAGATDVYNPPFGGSQSLGNVGTASSPRVVVINGDCKAGPGTGYGVLVVRGDLTNIGDWSWSGLILIIGQGSLIWQGGGGGSIDGAIVIARTHDTDRSSGNPLGTLLMTRGTVSADFNGGGNNGIHYNSSAINSSNRSFPYSVISYQRY
jgi:Tfp pilus assembly protein PilX